MTTYEPQDVTRQYADEHLDEYWAPEIAALFRAIPAEYRQSAEAEANSRSYRTEHRPGSAMLAEVPTGDIHKARQLVITEVAFQLGRAKP